MSGQQIYENFQNGRGGERLNQAATVIKQVESEYGEWAADIQSLTAQMESAWQGEAGGAARRGAGPLYVEHELAKPELDTAQDLTNRQVGSYDQARNAVQPVPDQPQKPGFWDNVTSFGGASTTYEQKTQQYNAANDNNANAMRVYEDASNYNASGMPTSYGNLTPDQSEIVITQPGEPPVDPGDKTGNRGQDPYTGGSGSVDPGSGTGSTGSSGSTGQPGTGTVNPPPGTTSPNWAHPPVEPSPISKPVPTGPVPPPPTGTPLPPPPIGGLPPRQPGTQPPGTRPPGGTPPGTRPPGSTPGTRPPGTGGQGPGGQGPGGQGPRGGTGGLRGGFGPGAGTPGGPGGSGMRGGAGGFGPGAGGSGFGPGGSGSGGAGGGGRSGAFGGGFGGADDGHHQNRGGTGGRGGSGAGMGGGMGGGGGQGEDDIEHQSPAYLLERDPESLFGTDEITAPPVIGE